MDDSAASDPRRPTRRLKLDLVDLAAAFDNASWEMSYFLDLETGRVILLTDDTRSQYDRLVEAIGDVDQVEWAVAFESTLKDWDLPDWQRESVREADQIEAGFGKRYIRVPPADSREGYQDMEAFIETVANERLAGRLARGIQGRGAFRYFKDVLLDFPKERERWFAFRDARQRQRVLEWLESEGVELVTGGNE
jgi:hypothetical protein